MGACRMRPDGVFDLTMHPQAIGRGHRLVMLERLIEADRRRPDGVVFEPLRRLRRAAGVSDHPLEEWLAGRPMHARRG